MAADSDGDIPPNQNKPHSATRFLGVVILLSIACVWFFRPWLHGPIYGLYTTPILWVGIPVCLLIGVIGLDRINYPAAQQALVIICIVGLLALTSVSGTFAANTLGQATMQESHSTDHLLETDPVQPRVLPKGVADRYAGNTLNLPQYQVTESDITFQNGTPYWSYALAPDGMWNYLTKKQTGTVLIDMTSQNTAVNTVRGEMQKGIRTAFYNDYNWHLLKRGEYLAHYEDPFMVIHNDQQYIAVPYTVPAFHWLPIPHTTPTWGGVMLIDANGEITDLSPEKARKHPALKGQKLYPFDLTRDRVAATKYRHGIINTLTSHKDEIEVAPVPGDGNDQPFLIPTTEGPIYVVAAEPYGTAQGLSEIWMVDARTGQQYRYTPNGSLFGPRKATDYIRQAARTTDWNRFTPAEPIPVVIDDQLYWEVQIVPSDNSGVAYTAFVNAQNSEVHEVETTAAVTNFLQNGAVPANQTSDRDDNESPTSPTMIVERVAPNGSVIGTLTIYENESIRIVQQNETDAGNRTTESRTMSGPMGSSLAGA
ncbi:ABC transporter permease [Halocatena marina]|uniref:ABC transporter permease n=1 Tax=Halocatena marina TaxID=2934937 RepID=UPI0020104994|nr:ABC transporter permease [Halocatena marina]